tara:strand:+ start:308 stop:418 length:111 start_codon:yes stop_codon:yes gene_type:complete
MQQTFQKITKIIEIMAECPEIMNIMMKSLLEQGNKQ